MVTAIPNLIIHTEHGITDSYSFVGEVSEGESSQEADGNDSGDETDGDSSVLSHSSHGGNTSIDEPKKPKRSRTAYSNYQLDQLELMFAQTQYPDIFLREDLSSRLGIREDRIQVRGLYSFAVLFGCVVCL